MITLDRFKRLMSFETKRKYCIEIAFSIKGNSKFSFCQMGKTPKESTDKNQYWFGLTPDGNNAFDYDTFDELLNAKVFDGRSLLEIWNSVTVLEIDGCAPEDRIVHYLGET